MNDPTAFGRIRFDNLPGLEESERAPAFLLVGGRVYKAERLSASMCIGCALMYVCIRQSDGNRRPTNMYCRPTAREDGAVVHWVACTQEEKELPEVKAWLLAEALYDA